MTQSDEERTYVDNGAGWRLAIKRTRPDPAERSLGTRPVLIVPGYGMNSFIFGFHPRGLSLEAFLASQGLEVWSVDLRAQGRSVRTNGVGEPDGEDRYGIADLALVDLGCAIDTVLARTRTGATSLDLLGASLGASLMFAHLACVPAAPVRAIVSMGGLVTWQDPHFALRAAFFSPWLVEQVRMKGTRRMVELTFSFLLRHAPSVLSIYLNEASTDLSQAQTMLNTVEDPNRFMNREIAEWIARRELVVRGVNVSRALASMKHPLLCIVANQDGIVPPATARAPFEAIGSKDKELLCVGEPHAPIAHADLFVATGAQEKVFAKIANFLLRPR
jgi:pimeloyl-ACP methyl ester carboxylesterase